MNDLLKKYFYTALMCSTVLTFSVEANNFSQLFANIFKTSQQQADDCNYDPDDARLPECKEELRKEDDCKYDPDSPTLPCLENKSRVLTSPKD